MNMEENMEIYRKPVFTKQWLCVRVLFVTGLSLFMTIVACGFDALALGRKEEFLLKKEVYILLTDSIDFCFALIFVTMMTLIVMEIAYRRCLNYLQYGLTACALCIFYLLLLAMAEKMPFAGICYGCDDDSNAHHLVLQVYNGESRILRACVCCARAGIWVGTDISIYRIIGIAYRKSLDICTLESVHVSFTKT